MKKPDDLNDVIREERSRGKKQPIDTDAIKNQEERKNAVLQIFRRGTREDLRALLKAWGYSKEEIEAALKKPHSRSTTLHLSSNLLSFRISLCPVLRSHFGGALVDLGCNALGQDFEPVFLRTF